MTPGYIITPEEMVLLVIAVVLVLPFARWAGEQLWKRVTGRQSEDSAQLAALAVEVRTGFQTLRDLIGGHQADLRELAVRVEHLEGEVGRLREDKHALSNQMQSLILSRKAGA